MSKVKTATAGLITRIERIYMVPREEATREYKCEYYTVMAHPKACFFCDHCTDIFVDWDGTPYMFVCIKDHGTEIERGLEGKCPDFYETND